MTNHTESSDRLELTEALMQSGHVTVVVEHDPDDPRFSLPAAEKQPEAFVEPTEQTHTPGPESALPIHAEPFVPAVPITEFPELDISLDDGGEIELVIPDTPATKNETRSPTPQPSRRAARYELLAGGKTL